MKAETLRRKLDDLEQQRRKRRKKMVYLWIDDPDHVPEPPEDADQVVYYRWQTADAPEPEA